ncbi:MAG: efflux RND transporter periplasmic adaptor subunit [bacterium]
MDRFGFFSNIRAFFLRVARGLRALWTRFRSLKLWQQGAIVLAIVVLIFAGLRLTHGDAPASASDSVRTVTLASVAELSGGGDSRSIIGSVRSVTEADVLSQAGGTIRAVHTSVGASVPAGFVIAEIENASERASVLSAEGAYDAAVAGRSITALQAGNSATSFEEAKTSARDTYRSAYTTVDTVLTTKVDLFFGAPSAYGPRLLINSMDLQALSRRRATIDDMAGLWKTHLAAADNTDPEALLSETDRVTGTLSEFLADLASAANERDSGATADQLAALASARANVDGLRAALSAARDAYRAKATAAQVGAEQSVSTGAQTASADAGVKQALGALRLAQANLEKTIIRAPIGGTVNFLPVRVGDYVTALTHVATVAQNGALEIVAYVSEDDRASLAVGNSVTVEDSYTGTVTSISPALDPVTKQIEVHVGVTGGAKLVNGQSVRIGFPALAKPSLESAKTLSLPLAAVKLRTDSRVVFGVGEDGRLIAHQVEIGAVAGDRIEITTPLPADLRIVTDARGLSEGEKVNVAVTGAP